MAHNGSRSHDKRLAADPLTPDRVNTAVSLSTNKVPKPLPKTLPGVVCAQRVRCGKPGCRCTRGQGHLAYYRFWREGGRLRKCYVRRGDLAAVRAACATRQREQRELSEAWKQWRQLVTVVREVTS
ncbi:DUF6788 family protein [Frigoriglobus tundricola]|uniref:DUF6788 domain-containing protein n=1 Tax=Frigoriglobus tundricola TaxID=2774151 RepID=A0A6M5Z003_9BACT|nr:hypothetical protein FTUN_6112 [Frigoriglobus tundricola]